MNFDKILDDLFKSNETDEIQQPNVWYDKRFDPATGKLVNVRLDPRRVRKPRDDR